MQVVDYILTQKNATVVFDNGNPVTVPHTDSVRFGKVRDMIRSNNLDDLLFLVDKAAAIDERTEGKFSVIDGTIVIDGEKLPEALSDRLLALVEAGSDTRSLENFWDNLKLNPTETSRKDLFAFLQANNVPITRDGCFIAYKKVLDTYWDSYTGHTHLNKPGMTVSMPRDQVDGNRNNTCSSGLHVAAFEYASGFSGTRLLEVKVNPRDVVAVPPDYNEQKMRVCKYQVLRETTTKYVEPLYEAGDGSEESVDASLVDKEETGEELVFIQPDIEGRVRIPGNLIRKFCRVGVGRRVSVFVKNDHELVLTRGNKKDGADNHYIAQSDNCIRISKKVLALAEIDKAPLFSVTESDEWENALVLAPCNATDTD